MPRKKTARARRQRNRRIMQWLICALAIGGITFISIGIIQLSNQPDADVPPVSSASSGSAATQPSLPAATTTVTQTTQTTQTTRPPSAEGYVQTKNVPWNLRLVNKWNPLPEDYAGEIVSAGYDGRKFDQRALDALNRLTADGRSHGVTHVVSLYRTHQTQVNLFEAQVERVLAKGNYTREEAEAIAATDTARPGTSEHQIGLAADILGSGYASLEESFENTEAFRWLYENCAEYGFILRYPKDKTKITGVMYEPWHYRYVGVEHARIIMQRGITLEEYVAELGL